ncbi:hypothetical protein MKW92_038630 [Papaver armeniacum]|nr:hypothetical protein MKW92_038630 [Papaver armeniacum]
MSSLKSTTMQQGVALSKQILLLLFLTLPQMNLIAIDPIEGVHAKHHKKKFAPGPWKQAHATFYEGSATTYAVTKHKALFNDGYGCGSCYEIKCVNDPQWCKPDNLQSFNNGGWCNPPNHHFDLSKTAFLEIAEYKAGIVPVQYRRVPCKKQGGIRFTISGNPYYNKVLIWNVSKFRLDKHEERLGSYWITMQKCVGESLTFRVIASDGRSSTSWHVTHENWQFGQTFKARTSSNRINKTCISSIN